jgi:hypothetical protein
MLPARFFTPAEYIAIFSGVYLNEDCDLMGGENERVAKTANQSDKNSLG